MTNDEGNQGGSKNMHSDNENESIRGSDKSSGSSPPLTLKVVFVHLDLGIGGAEQLVLQLATASQALGHSVTLLTTRCDQDHCFAAVKAPEGALSACVQVWGRWIPPNLLGVGTALCSHVRVLYLAAKWSLQRQREEPCLVVLDVLPTPLWILRYFTNSSLLFYCHFPDKLLIRSNNNNNHNNNNTTLMHQKNLYRTAMDAMEESCMPLTDLLLVNSKFTLQTVRQEFSSLAASQLHVLYPALDDSLLAMDASTTKSQQQQQQQRVTIVSLNRYERKKKIELILHAYALIRDKYPSNSIQVVIAGGYDTRNVENVQYRGELEQLAFGQLGLNKTEVCFMTSISDAQRTHLLQTARCVVYTPPNEHFGIVPLEVMYAGTPVICCNSGGPLETIVHGKTGFLCDPTPEAFADALHTLLQDPAKAATMGQAGHVHARDNFGRMRLQKEWDQYTQQAWTKGQQRVAAKEPWPLVLRAFRYLVESVLALVGCILLTMLLRKMGWLESQESILGSMRRRFQSDEL